MKAKSQVSNWTLVVVLVLVVLGKAIVSITAAANSCSVGQTLAITLILLGRVGGTGWPGWPGWPGWFGIDGTVQMAFGVPCRLPVVGRMSAW